MQDRNLAAFDSLSRLRVLGLMDVTLLNLSVPDDSEDRRVRTSGSEVNSMAYGMADTLGQLEHLSTWEAVVPKFNNREDECLFGLFDSRVGSNQGGRVTKYLHDWFPFHFSSELKKLRDNNDTIESALRRSFLSLNKELGAKVFNSNLEMNLDFQREKNAASNLGIDDNKSGASGLIAYIKGTTLYVANVGDIVAVISRNRGNASPIAQKHSPMTPSEIARIRNAGGFISHKRLVNGELEVSRSFGHFHLIPAINANPTVEIVHLEEQDEFIIIATRGLWDRISYQTAVDIAYNEYTERGDLMRAAQKLRDFAIAYGAEDSIMVMIVGVEDIFGRGTRKWESKGTDNSNNIVGNTYYIRARRRDEDKPSDSTIARLQKEIEPPTGKIALVFTDIKNSTFLWETIPIAMRHAIKSHNSIMRRQLRNIGGYEVKTEGDAFMVSFPTVSSALLWCFTVQMQLLRADWPNELLELVDGKEVYGGHDSDLIYRGLSVRMGIHWGSPVCEIDPITKRMDYFGPMVNRAARICNAADGGQICVSADVESEIRLLEAMIDNDPTMGTSRKNSQDAEGEYEVAAAAAAALESNGRVEGPPSLSSNSGIDKTILSLRKMGFVVRKIGETKLKGLENPEELSLIYPEPLKGRLEEDQKKANQRSSVITPEKIYEPSTQILDPSSIRALGYLCLRLERVASGYVNTRRTRNSRTDYLTGLLTFHVKDNADDEELLRITESLITRIENAISTLALKKVGAYSKVLDTIITDPELVSKALQMCIQILGASK
ncbi:2514_t:CDS:2 [Ambispora gerdemannii]|uniref:2514_t:CDS:1 n=1 Tax=Ambispora gerdemannii TaxID=144530 RepID=A0A9N8V390_9GLOM|nr:2514_t:CDS:2 [Ambispora gerdemannii]